jgi:hypothetical protein
MPWVTGDADFKGLRDTASARMNAMGAFANHFNPVSLGLGG